MALLFLPGCLYAAYNSLATEAANTAMSDRSGYPPDAFHYAYKPSVVKSDYFVL